MSGPQNRLRDAVFLVKVQQLPLDTARGVELLTKRLPSQHLPIRLLGFGVNNFKNSGTSQQLLFDQPDRERHQELDRVADQITAKFGKLAIRRGAKLDKTGE